MIRTNQKEDRKREAEQEAAARNYERYMEASNAAWEAVSPRCTATAPENMLDVEHHVDTYREGYRRVAAAVPSYPPTTIDRIVVTAMAQGYGSYLDISKLQGARYANAGTGVVTGESIGAVRQDSGDAWDAFD